MKPLRNWKLWTSAIMLAVSAWMTAVLLNDGDPFNRGYKKPDFESVGLQPGQRLPPLTVRDLDGRERALSDLCADGPVLIVAASLTCPISSDACRQELAALADELAPRIQTVALYTIEAHPVTDPSPYSGKEWVTARNRKDGILRRQPTTLPARLALAREFVERTNWRQPMVVDDMDNAAWIAFGSGSNVALLVDRDGRIIGRNGWFSPDRMRQTINQFRARQAGE